MDFNIVTFHTAYNQGAVLQTIALQEFIAQQGYTVGVYDYRPPYTNPFTGSRGLIFKLFRKIHEKEYELKEKRFCEFCQENLNLNLEKNSKIFLSGSDQVWNPTGSMNPIYFLNFVSDDSLRASYAASMGVCKVPETKKELFKKYINKFDMVSVRENDVKTCIEDYYDGSIWVNVDPTLLMESNFWEKYMNEVPNMPNKYILVYVLHLPKNINKLLKWLKKATGYQIVLIDGQGLMTHLIKHDVALHNVGPKEFLWLISHSESVVTSSFHGTAFSLIFQKEFYSIVNPASPSRINNILNVVGLEPVNESDINFSRNTDIQWHKIKEILKKEREKSVEYIKSVYDLACTEYRKPLYGTIENIKDRCTGCSACESTCPTGAIKMELNCDGFYTPIISGDMCIHCSKCLKVCPLDKKIGELKKRSYYGWHKDSEVRYNSSSGGVFRALADEVIAQGGVVYGAVYSKDWRTVTFDDSDHTSLENIQKSKYTASNPSGIYPKIKKELDLGRKVLFCGTPCQNAGLTKYLGRPYSNLLRCDFVCGGMSSLTFYREHLETLEKKYNSKIEKIDFRPKKRGWGKQRIQVNFKNGKRYMKRSHLDSYFKCFANEHVSVRETCLDCEFYSYHVSDITLADFWGYKMAKVKKFREGLSLIVGNTKEGIYAIESARNLILHELDPKYSDYAFRSKSPNMKKLEQQREFFLLSRENGFEKTAETCYATSELAHVKAFIKSKLK